MCAYEGVLMMMMMMVDAGQVCVVNTPVKVIVVIGCGRAWPICDITIGWFKNTLL